MNNFIDNELLFDLSKSGHYLHLVHIYVHTHTHTHTHIYIHGI